MTKKMHMIVVVMLLSLTGNAVLMIDNARLRKGWGVSITLMIDNARLRKGWEETTASWEETTASWEETMDNWKATTNSLEDCIGMLAATSPTVGDAAVIALWSHNNTDEYTIVLK